MRLAKRISRIKPSATLTINAKAGQLKQSGINIVNFGVGEPDFGTPEHICKAAVRSIWDGHTRYTPVGGTNELKDAIRRRIQVDYGLSYGRENVLVCCGGKHALYNLFLALLDPGDEVIIPAPYWVSYPEMVELADATPVIVSCSQENGFRLDPEDLERAITPKTRLLILNSPSNPTGKYYAESDLRKLADVLLKHENVLIASDDIYYRILFGGRKWAGISMIEEKLRDRTFIINGVSKSYCMTGWRIGYLIGDADAIKAATKIQGQSTSNPTSIAQWAALEALESSQVLVDKMTEVFENRSRHVLDRLARLPGVTCPEPDGAFYVFPNVSACYGKMAGDRRIENSLDLADYLMEAAHVAVVPGSAFGNDQCLRFSYALSAQDIDTGFDSIEKALLALK